MDRSIEISSIFKAEYSNIVAVLCHYYGVIDIQLAEDIVSDTFLTAMKSWSHNDIPDNPRAWLRKVAQNKLTDYYRRQDNYQNRVVAQYRDLREESSSIVITEEVIADSQLRMLFVVCDPNIKIESQICMALRILCGFNIVEIAKALLSNKESINKKLFRAKKLIREKDQLGIELTERAYIDRLDNVLRVIYLMFNEGYYSSCHEETIRSEICWEAMRLSLLLSKQDFLPKPRIHALLALMCFHASRIYARTSESYSSILFTEQDRSKWDLSLIKKGEHYLNLAATGNTVSKYHIEAAIAYWHTTDVSDKWNNILQLYNKLLTIEYSTVIAMNRTFALAMANSVKEAIREAEKLSLGDNHYYYCLLAELYRMDNNTNQELIWLERALHWVVKKSEKALIQNKIEIAKGL